MENASNALLIAGGVLLAILVLTLFIYMFSNANTIGSAQDEKTKLARLAEWNAEWEAYKKEVAYGVDVLTVVNKAKQNNIEYNNDSKYFVTIEINGTDNNGIQITTNNIRNYKKSVFKCEEIRYSTETGRVNYMRYSLITHLDSTV